MTRIDWKYCKVKNPQLPETKDYATKDREKRLGRKPFSKIGHVEQSYILENLKSHAHAQKRPKKKSKILPLTVLCVQCKQEVKTNPEMRNGLAVLKKSPSKSQSQSAYTRKVCLWGSIFSFSYFSFCFDCFFFLFFSLIFFFLFLLTDI